MRVVVVDGGSSSIPELVSSLKKVGVGEVEVLGQGSGLIDADAYVFSGRARKSKEVDKWVSSLMRSCRKPALLICYSAELFNLLRGGSLIKSKKPIDDFIRIKFLRPSKIWREVGEVEFFVSRGYRISRLGKGLEVIAESEEMGVEAYEYNEFYGVLFHPELSGEQGLKLLRNFLYG